MRKYFITLIAIILTCTAACGQAGTAETGWVTSPADSLLAERVLTDLALHAGEPVSRTWPARWMRRPVKSFAST